MRYNKSKIERVQLEKNHYAETERRIKEVTGGKFEAAFGYYEEKKTVKGNMKYIALPVQELIWQYNLIVDMAQDEVDVTQAFIKAKELDITRCKIDTNKFLSQNRGMKAWDTYEVQLAQERVVNERLKTHILDKNGNDIDKLIVEAQ